MGANFRLKGNTGIGSLMGDLLTQSQKNITNWDITGDIQNAYVDGVNTVSFGNSGGGGGSYVAPNGRTYKYYYKVKYVNGYGWHAYSSVKAGSYMNDTCYIYCSNGLSGNKTLYTFKSTSSSKTPYSGYYDNEGNLVDVYSSSLDTGDREYNANADFKNPSNATESNVENFSTPDELTNWLKIIEKGFDGYVELPLLVEAGKTYAFRFGFCSPSGFTSDESNICIKSGGAELCAILDGTTSQNLRDYALVFTADGDTATVVFDLSKMINSEEVILKVGNISLYELGG